jgi:bifunctional UDP-N-acetylglucosamine pyrophosphorylase/glucosamine-1-phosphate N-acetyltransferase
MVSPLHVVILAAGEGQRLKSLRPKVLTPLWGRPAVRWPVEAARALSPESMVVVGGKHLNALETALETPSSAAESLSGRFDGATAGATATVPVSLAHQEQPLGTGHAVLAARSALASAEGSLLILYGDCPLLPSDLLAQLVEAHRAQGGGLSLLSVSLADPTGYGRILRDPEGRVTAIVEETDATPEQKTVQEVNAGVWVVDLPGAWEQLERIGTGNKQGEVYLTDLVDLTVQAGGAVQAHCWPEPEDVLGFNDQAQLAEIRAILRRRILRGHLARGVEIVDPSTTFIDAEVSIEPGASIQPCTVIEGRTSIASGCVVGPFAHLREGTVLESGAKVGNFTETKQAVLGPGVKAGHLSYLGNAKIGAGTNIGAGTITANYDGTHKHETRIGASAFIGSGTVLVAPSEVGDEAITGAGAIVTRGAHIGPGEVWVGVPARPMSHRAETEADS